MATRAASGKVLNAAATVFPSLMGGSADLAPSNKTFIDGSPEFQKKDYTGRNIHFGVREFAMGAIMSGMFLHGGIRPYGGTFLVFADYVRPAIRLAALMKLPVIYVFTHDSVAVGEDGPTHQPVEHLASLHHPQSDGHPPGRRHRDRSGLAQGHCHQRPTGGLDPQPPEAADSRCQADSLWCRSRRLHLVQL